jgi:hypothetical protein
MSDNQTPSSGTQAIEEVANLLKAADAPAEVTAAKAETKVETVEPGNPDDSLGDAGKQAIERMKAERNEAKRQAAELKAKLDKIEAANMSDLERAQKEAREAQEAAARATADALRFRVAAQHGISEEDAELFLTGTDADTLTKQATRLKERTPTTPKPDPTQGAQNVPALNGDELTQALARAVGAR